MSLASNWLRPVPDQATPLAATDRSVPAAVRIPRQQWRTSYGRILLISDFAVLLVAMGAAQFWRFGSVEPEVNSTQGPFSYSVLSGVVAIAWWASLQFHRTRSAKVIGHGTEEYRRVFVATFRVFALLAMISVILKVDASRGYLAIALPVGLIGLLLGRKLARAALHRRRGRGEGLANVLIVGGVEGAAQITEFLRGRPAVGYHVSGVWVPDGSRRVDTRFRFRAEDLPVLKDVDTLADALRESQARAVLVTDTDHLGAHGLRELTWQLDGTGVELMISPNVLDVVGSRLHLHDLSGMPMLHVDEPQYAGAARYTKSLFDRVGAALLIVGFSPLLLATAAAIKLSSTGPFLYRQERVGRNGEHFAMIKFRSMREDADAELAMLLVAEGKSLAELPKLTRDPRVTRVGAFIRRFSIDELPQLFNVVKGDMSLVGPRPQRDFEVAEYDHVAHRRLTVRPGMTGLWQVSGRSDLSYDEAIRLDVHYVENWSMTSDLAIMWRTMRAVAASDGAY